MLSIFDDKNYHLGIDVNSMPRKQNKLGLLSSSPVLPGPSQEDENENLRDSSTPPELKQLFVVGFVVQNSTSIYTLMFSPSGLKSCLKLLA